MVQMWVQPSATGLTPNYGSSLSASSFGEEKTQEEHLLHGSNNTATTKNVLRHLATPVAKICKICDDNDEERKEEKTEENLSLTSMKPVHIHQDINAYAAELELGKA